MTDIQVPQFKVWDNDKKKWVEQCLIFNTWFKGEQDVKVFCKLSCDIKGFDTIDKFEVIEIGSPILCRFTGLLDKNNKPIYENDIIEYSDNKYCISFYAGAFGFWANDNFHLLLSYRHSKKENICQHLKLIGNKFENHELLEVTNG